MTTGASMQFDTKIAVVIRTELEAWQKLNVASFLTSGIASAFPQCIGEAYEDRSGTRVSVADRSAHPDLWRGPPALAPTSSPRSAERARHRLTFSRSNRSTD
jgi:Protein of unknown function (DUF2000)